MKTRGNYRHLIFLSLFLLLLCVLGLFKNTNLTAASSLTNKLAADNAAKLNLADGGACTRFDLEEGRNATTGAGVAGRYEMREVGSGRLLAVWRATSNAIDSGWIEGISSSFSTGSWVEVYFYPDGQTTATKLEILNVAPNTEYGWVKPGLCHAVELQFPAAGVNITNSESSASNSGTSSLPSSAGSTTSTNIQPTAVEPTATSEPLGEDVAVADTGGAPAPTPTNVPIPTATLVPPTATAGSSEVPSIPAPPALPADWLIYINDFRQSANIPTVSENQILTQGSAWHSSYMVLNDEPIAHSEDPDNPLFDELGNEAAIKGNIFATTQLEGRYNWAINFWLSAPFHAIPLLDPRLESIGYGDFVNDGGTFKMAAVADVRSGLGELPESVSYPIFFPGNGTQTWVARLSMNEWPSPYGNCPGYQQPTGPALVLQLGPGDVTPNVSNAVLANRGQTLDICVFDETTYRNSDHYAQGVGRSILSSRDAVVIIPRNPFIVGETYEVYVVANGETHTWSFEVIKPLPLP